VCEDGDDSDSDSDEKVEMKITDDGSYLQSSNGLDPEYVPVYRARMRGDQTVFCTDGDNRTFASVVHQDCRLTPRRWMWCL
jgi:hypothetical protein